MNEDIKGKNIVITGASSGIGRQCAISCNKAGAIVHLMARNSEKLAEVSSFLEDGKYTLNSLDVTCSESIESSIKSIVGSFGKIDGFIHSAGIQMTQPFHTMDKSHYLQIFDVNTFAAFDVSRYLVRKPYRSANGLSIVFISSVLSTVGGAGVTSYCASKAALVGGARSMAAELASRSVRVNCVSPGTIENTEMIQELKTQLNADEFHKIIEQHPLGLGQTDDVAKLCIFLLSDDSRWITGQNLVIDGGYSAI